ncbi:hypothetical protein Ga0123462_0847 [Mariprofundus ferrinatatus]|uniref:Uncharacterized protein n=1 Tax=Mariprofundus ferrinatatus TaxID=1921087 RepID=A0A2K8LBU6_9PROT|nr:hypothetical protein [Mariprofundus ferrinatatus]ATX81716.1 hypothetical protein Ga0123462_0847 [Mariprofundus ferrinatatus]
MSDVVKYEPEQALFEVTLLNAEEAHAEFDDIVIEGIKSGIPPELLTRLKQLWEKTKLIAGEVVAIGKIIVRAIFNFFKANPKLSIGIAIGAAVTVLIAAIPIFGPLLAPTAALLGITYGAAVGAARDKGDYSGNPFDAAVALAEKFFELMKEIFNAVQGYWVAA